MVVELDLFAGLKGQLEGFIVDNHLQDKFVVVDEDQGLALIAQDLAMFAAGSATIRQEVQPYLLKIGAILQQIDHNIVVEGHTDNIPINTTRFSSNWELSVMRATNVIHFLTAQSFLDPTRLTAAGYAFYRPRYDMTSAAKARNRRIEVIIRKKYSRQLVDELLQLGKGTRELQDQLSAPAATGR